MNYRTLFLKLFAMGLLLLSLGCISGCKKYPDGPAISLLPKSWRLEENWKKQKVYKNGTDISDLYLAKTKSESFNIKKGGAFTYDATNSSGSISYSGTWAFSTDKTVVYFSYYYGANYLNDSYLILRLKEDDLWMKWIDPSGDEYEYHYVPN
ncbi:MAG TPA: hypothetical protein VGO45_07690 [Bacteroidia bacterium]|jgi:hypothetical protein|nr:hypothetical protein [Bacteroidia bacterium]